jgi:hypothetical protein
MKRLVRVVLCVLVLALVLAAPAAATAPTDVSGTWTGKYTIPPQPTNPCVPNCHLVATMTHIWADGNFQGTSESEWHIFGQGPCGDSKPNCCHALLKATGTFVGSLELDGQVYAGSFDYRLQWQVIHPDPDQTGGWDTFVGKLVILRGYDGLEGLHGVLEQWGRTGPTAKGGRVTYAGQVHLDPQP